MAIGSAPEIGVSFGRFGDLNDEQRRTWYEQVRAYGPNLLAGYGVLAYPRPWSEGPCDD